MIQKKIIVLDRKQSVSLRKDLYQYLADIEAVFDDDQDIQHWNNMTHHWKIKLDKYEFSKIIEVKHLEIPDCFEQLLEWSDIDAVESDDKNTIYEHIKFLLEAIIFILPNRIYNFSRFDAIPLFSYFVFFVPLYLAISDGQKTNEILFCSFFATFLTLTVTFVCKIFEEKNHKRRLAKICLVTPTLNVSKALEKNEPELPSDKKANMPFVIFASVFAIIASIAMTEILYDLMDPTNEKTMWDMLAGKNEFERFSNFLIHPKFILTASFFSVGVLFYQCGIVFLSTEASEYVSKNSRKITVFFSSLVLFIEGIVLVFVAYSTDSVTMFAFWIFMLMAIDMGWIFLNLLKHIDALVQWLHFDFATLLFTMIVVLLLSDKIEKPIDVYWYILILFTARTLYDYGAAWKFWTKFIPKE